jgi:hypothetical protein
LKLQLLRGLLALNLDISQIVKLQAAKAAKEQMTTAHPIDCIFQGPVNTFDGIELFELRQLCRTAGRAHSPLAFVDHQPGALSSAMATIDTSEDAAMEDSFEQSPRHTYEVAATLIALL